MIFLRILLIIVIQHVMGKKIQFNDALMNRFDLKLEIERFCHGKSKNFCSEANIKIMF